jgi:hypothetical protein
MRMEELDIQSKNKETKAEKIARIAPYQWKKGQSGNIMGRPPGKSMKEYVRQYLERMTDEERDEWLEGLPKELIWKLAEGNPKQDTDVTSDGKKLQISFDAVFLQKHTKPEDDKDTELA